MSKNKMNVGRVDYKARDRFLLKQALRVLEKYDASFTVTKTVALIVSGQPGIVSATTRRSSNSKP